MRLFRCFILLILAVFVLPVVVLAADVYKVGDRDSKIASAQQKLPLLGITTDRKDGLLTKSTSQAIKSFQRKYARDYKLRATGLLDDNTYRAILAEAGKKAKPEPNIRGSAKGMQIVKTASIYRGVPYRFGGVDNNGFDCSGYTMTVFAKHNITLPRLADVQFKEGIFVLKKDLQPGDLVFFTTYEKGASHVGIYAGSGRFWHASSSKGVMLSALDEEYWKKRYIGSRRVLSR